MSQGVKQGCKLSPTLFSLYINDLANEIKQMNLGVDIDELQLSILPYADDVALIAPDADSLQLMLDKLNEWCCKWRLTVNNDKTKIVHFRPASVQLCNNQFSCGNASIQLTEKYKYLGLWLQEHLDMKYSTSELANQQVGPCRLYMLNSRIQGVWLMMYIISSILLLCSQYCLIVRPFGD